MSKTYFAAVALHTSQQNIVFGPFTLQANYLMVAFFTLKSAINSLIVLTSLFTPRIASTHFAFCFLTPVSLASPSLECRCRLHCIIAGILSNSIDLQMVVCLSTGRQADGGSQSAKQKLQSPAATFLFFQFYAFTFYSYSCALHKYAHEYRKWVDRFVCLALSSC